MRSRYAVKVSNLPIKATVRDVEEFFSSGHVEKVDLCSIEGEETQVACVSFKDAESVDMALLLSGSAILDKEVIISIIEGSDPSADEEISDKRRVGAGRSPSFAGAQILVNAVVSRSVLLGQDVWRRAKSLGEKRRTVPASTTGDEIPMVCNCKETNENISLGETSEDANDSLPWTNNNIEAKPKAKSSMEKCFKHALAINEKLQLGTKTMSVLSMAQQGVCRTGVAVANNRYVAAGGAWVSGAVGRVVKNPYSGLDSASDASSNKTSNEQVQLTEMTTFQSSKAE